MSVFLEDRILADDRSPLELYDVFEGYSACYFTVAELVQTFKQSISEDSVPFFPGHALVQDPSGKRSAGTRSNMARAARWYQGSPR